MPYGVLRGNLQLMTERDEGKGVHGAIHELKQPLNVIRLTAGNPVALRATPTRVSRFRAVAICAGRRKRIGRCEIANSGRFAHQACYERQVLGLLGGPTQIRTGDALLSAQSPEMSPQYRVTNRGETKRQKNWDKLRF